MIDVSDGIMLDAKRLAIESGAGLTIEAALLPLSAEMKRYMESSSDTEAGLLMALTGGEDYELLFTAEPEQRAQIEKISSELKLGIKKIGSVTSDIAEVRVIGDDGAEILPEHSGYDHFRDS